MKPIVQDGDPVLRESAKPVPDELFGTPELVSILKDMEEALEREPDGVALAAPQIGVPYRIFIVRFDRTRPPQEPLASPELGVFINPVFTNISRRREEMDEGCLSVRHVYGKTLRHERATVRAKDASGKVFERGGGGLLAQIYQHETDHLDGTLFTDHAMDLVTYERSHEPTS